MDCCLNQSTSISDSISSANAPSIQVSHTPSGVGNGGVPYVDLLGMVAGLTKIELNQQTLTSPSQETGMNPFRISDLVSLAI